LGRSPSATITLPNTSRAYRPPVTIAGCPHGMLGEGGGALQECPQFAPCQAWLWRGAGERTERASRLGADAANTNRQHTEPLKRHIQPHVNDRSPGRRLTAAAETCRCCRAPNGRIYRRLLVSELVCLDAQRPRSGDCRLSILQHHHLCPAVSTRYSTASPLNGGLND
jgi:hypothetical protein